MCPGVDPLRRRAAGCAPDRQSQLQATRRHRESQALPHLRAVARAYVQDVEGAEQHGDHHLDFLEGEVAAGANPRPAAERHHHSPCTAELPRRVRLPALGPEAGGIRKAPAVGTGRPHEADHQGTCRDGNVGDDGVACRLQRHDRRNRLEPEGFVGAGFDRIEHGELLVAGRMRIRAEGGAHRAGEFAAGGSVLVQQVDHPGQGVRCRVLSGQQHRQHVGGDVVVVQAAVAGIARQDHRFDQVPRLLSQGRIGVEAPARLVDELLDGVVKGVQMPVDLAIPRQLATVISALADKKQ